MNAGSPVRRYPASRWLAPAGALVFLAAALAGCGGDGGGTAAPPAPGPSAAAGACPGAARAPGVGAWPAPVPADLPKPPGSGRARVAQETATLTVVEVPLQISLREAVLFVLRTFPEQGFTLGRGDAEPGQADAPFTRSGLFGQVRLNFVDDCRTQWLVAIGKQGGGAGGTSPLLPQPSPSGATPFPPFGG